jgi:sirohydrochlorin cobaltochelatase
MDCYVLITIRHIGGRPYNRWVKTGLILFAHGARDPRWSEPFERLRVLVAARRPEVPIALAYLERMTPDLMGAADALVADGCRALRVVPVFLGQGGHIRQDLPRLVEALRSRYPAVPVELEGAVGEDAEVLASIAGVALRGLDR